MAAEPTLPLPQKNAMTANKIARNDPCPCGRGKKYKNCCLPSESRQSASPLPASVDISDALQLATQHHHAGRLSEADAVCQRILQMSPNHPDALHLLGMIAYQIGMHDVAETFFSNALDSAPNFADGHNNLGVVLMAQGKMEEASASYQKTISLMPTHANAHYNLGNVLEEQGRLEEAVASYQAAISLKPDYAEAHNNLGSTLEQQGKLVEAIASFRRVLLIKPDSANAYRQLGRLLLDKGFVDDAVEFGRRAVSISPDSAGAHVNLGNALQAQGKLDDAIASFRQALKLKPELAMVYSNLLYTMQYLSTVTPMAVFREHQHYAERYETQFKAHWQLHKNIPDEDRRLKIGYVSGDFRNHAVAFFIEPILDNHDKLKVEVYCYYNNTQRDSYTDRIAAYADHWVNCARMSDEQLVERIRVDGIDILVDLSGHTAHNRLLVFARKPAPVQATWIGYPSTGLTAMDYRITDAYMDPPGLTECYHSEELIRLPDTLAAYRPLPDCPPVNPLPALTSGELIFACLNNLIKINIAVTKLWARILTALPHSRLMIGNVADSGTRQRLVEMFGKAGIGAERLILQPRMPIADYLALHQQIDLALDPFPYNGGTSTLHSLWMGVPVITLVGEHTVSRAGVAYLSRVGLSEFITHSEEEYLQRAIQRAQDLPGLNQIRQTLRERMSGANSEPGTITRHLEAAYRNIWRKWCAAHSS